MDHQTAVAGNRAALQATIEFGLRKLGAVKWEPAAGWEAAGEGEQAPGATRGTAMMLRAVLPASVPGEAVYRTYSAVTPVRDGHRTAKNS